MLVKTKRIFFLITTVMLLVVGLGLITTWILIQSSFIEPLDSKTGTFSSYQITLYIDGEKSGLLSFDIEGNTVYKIYIYADNNSSNPPIFAMDGLTAWSDRTFSLAEMERTLYFLPETGSYRILIVQSANKNITYSIQTFHVTNPFLFYGGLPLGALFLLSSLSAGIIYSMKRIKSRK